MASSAIRQGEGSIRRALLASSWPRLSACLFDGLLTTPRGGDDVVGHRQEAWGARRRYSGGHPFQTPTWGREKDESSTSTSSASASASARDDRVKSKRETTATAATTTPTTTSSQTGWSSWYRAHVRPYMQLSRADKPIGTWLLLWPSWWSICLAAPLGGPLDLGTLGMFGAGAVLLRGAGCTVNDMWDRDYDRQVERTKDRPLASGALSQGQALGWLALQLSAGLGILLQLPPTSQLIGATSLPFVVAYPLMKRITRYPQAFLGLTINWGAIMGWAAVHDGLEWGVVGPLYASGFFWTLLYDTIYAHQDKRDDARVGIKSTALTFGDRTKTWLSGFGAANVACLSAAGAMAGCHAPFYGGVAAAAAHLAWQVGTVDLDDPDDCMAKFKSNVWYGAAVCAGIAADRLL